MEEDVSGIHASVDTQSMTNIGHASGWQPINKPTSMDQTYDEADSESGDEAEDDDDNISPVEDLEDMFLQENYFDHYGYLEYIKSPYKDPESVQATGAVTNTNKRNTSETDPMQKKGKKADLNALSSPSTPVATHGNLKDTISARRLSFKKSNRSFTEEEDAWPFLFHAKLRAEIGKGTQIKAPSSIPIAKAFNAFFAARSTFEDDTAVEPRSAESLRGKINHKEGRLLGVRRGLRDLLGGKKGGVVFVPVVTEEYLASYRD